jgi:hypothetical protein
MGAVTVAIVKRQVLGGTARNVVADVTFSGTYGAGGDTYTPSQFGLTTVHAIIPQGAAVGSTTTGYQLMPDIAGNKLRLIGGAASGVAGAETATGAQTGTVCRVLVIGDAPYV